MLNSEDRVDSTGGTRWFFTGRFFGYVGFAERVARGLEHIVTREAHVSADICLAWIEGASLRFVASCVLMFFRSPLMFSVEHTPSGSGN